MGLSCFLCNQVVVGVLHELRNHFINHHGLTLTRGLNETGFICGQDDCRCSFKNFYSLRRHIIDNHAGLLINNLNNAEEGARNIPDVIVQEAENNEILPQEDVDMQPEDLLLNVDEDNNNNNNLEDLVIKMLQKLHSNTSVTGAMVSDIFRECENFCFYTRNFLKTKMKNELQVGQVIDQEFINRVDQVFEFDSPFEGKKSYSQQISTLIDKTNYIEPLEILLGKRLDSKLNKKTLSYTVKMVPESYQYVPIIEVLKLVLSSARIRELINSEEPSPEGCLASSIDGQYFKNHPFFKRFKNAIRIKLYFDELEIVNPLGSKTGIHKLAAFYYQIDNLPEKISSNLPSVHVLLLCSHEDILKYGFHKILKPFFEDLNKLESDDGIPVVFDNAEFVIRGSLFCFCGDGLAVHEIYNHLSPSANQFCRMCMYTRQQ